MQNSPIPGLDFINLSGNLTENSNPSQIETEISLPIFGDNFLVPASFSNGRCRSLEEFKKEKFIKNGVPECFYQCQDQVKKRSVTLVRYKKLKSLDEELKYLLHELEIIRNLKHHHILQYYEAVSIQLTNVYLVFEPCACFLFDLIEEKVDKLYELPVVKNVMLQLLEALNYIHEYSIMHRNIQPGSIAIDGNGCLKVCNFRNARWECEKDTSIQLDKASYQSPESLMQIELQSTSVDIWSAACILAELLLGSPLFHSDDPRQTLGEVFSIFGFPTVESWPDFFNLPEANYFYYDKEKTHSYNCLDLHLKKCNRPQDESTMDLMQSMFCLDPKSRSTASQCSTHSYFSKEPLACRQHEFALCVNIALTKSRNVSGRN